MLTVKSDSGLSHDESMELNLIYHMHYIAGVVINFDLLLMWVGIYLYLVIANNILTNTKSNAQL